MAESKRPLEKRRTIRIPVDFPTRVTAGKKKFSCKALEFSEYGILIASDRNDLVGTDVELDLLLESANKPVSLQGVVVYSIDAGLGIRFKNITEEHRTLLKSYVHSHDPRLKPPPVRA
ncbi:MAG: PilZ domain-containing protein [Acidobacteria bacterium]|nr:PilZ domain-containing protein [Acidobacteriota bacterium]